MTSKWNVREGEDEHEKLGILSTRDKGEYFKAMANLSLQVIASSQSVERKPPVAWVSPGRQPLQSLDLWHVDGEGGRGEARPVP